MNEKQPATAGKTPGEIPRAGSRRKRAGLWLVGLVVVLGVVIYGVHWWRVGRFQQSTDDAYVGGNVTVITPHVSGYVEKILIGDNRFVHAGQPLIRLQAQDFQAARDAAAARVDAAQASLLRLQAQRALDQVMIRAAAADLQTRRASQNFAHQDASRYAHLAATEAGSRQNAQRSETTLQQASAQVASADAALAAARQQLVVVDAQSVQAQASLKQARAGLHASMLDLGYTVIRAPGDGYVGDRSAHPGTYVTAGSQLMSLVPSQGLWIDANFKEDQIRAIKPGDPVQVVADVDGRNYHGHVLSLAPATGAVFSVIPAQNATGNFTKIVQRVPVRIALDGRDATLGALRPGLSTTVTVNTHGHRS